MSFNVTCSGPNHHGIYLRELPQLEKPTEISVTVDPLFEEKAGQYCLVYLINKLKNGILKCNM